MSRGGSANALGGHAARRREIGGRRPREAEGRWGHGRLDNEPPSPPECPSKTGGPSFRFHRSGYRLAGSSDRPEFRKYYPTVEDFSEGSRRSRTFERGSSQSEDFFNREYPAEYFSVSSEDEWRRKRNGGSHSGHGKPTRLPRPSTPRGKTSTPKKAAKRLGFEATRQQDDITGVSIDSRTYILHSSRSDLNPTLYTTPTNGIPRIEWGAFGEHQESGDRSHSMEENFIQDALSTADCFAQLHRRIEILEDVLQQTIRSESTLCTLPSSECSRLHSAAYLVQPPPYKSESGADSSRTIRPKESVSREPELLVGCGDGARSKQSETQSLPRMTHGENSETELELRNIKKRLRLLEKKLKTVKKASVTHSNLYTSSMLEGLIMDEEDLARDLIWGTGCSECSSILSPEFYCLLKGQSPISMAEEQFCTKEVLKEEVNEKKFFSKCKKLKRKCSNLIRSPRNCCKSRNHCHKIPHERKEMHCDHFCPSSFCPAMKNGGNKSTTKVIYIRECPCEQFSQVKPQRKKRRKKQKISQELTKAAALSSQNKDIIKENKANQTEPEKLAEEIRFPLENQKFEFCRTETETKTKEISKPLLKAPENTLRVSSSNYWTTCPMLMSLTGRHCGDDTMQICNCLQWKNSTAEGEKPKKEKKMFRNPLDILRRGGNIKIPVLFEELCKGKRPKEVVKKTSNVSMRFVLVEEDKNPLNSLRKLIKKLSQTHTAKGTEQYVFGVSKCCCDNEVRGMGLLTNKNVLGKFGLG